jgi:integron integrase
MSLDQDYVEAIRAKGYSPATIKTYSHWFWKYLRHLKATVGKGQWVDPKTLSEREVEAWLSYLANKENVSPTSQNVALAAILFLYRQVYKRELKGIDAMRAKKSQHVPIVLSSSEVNRIIDKMTGPARLSTMIQFGCGLRINEALALRVKDIDFDRRQLIIHGGKGAKDRVTLLPEPLHEPIRHQLASMRVLYEKDRENDFNGVSVPYALTRKIPSAPKSWEWFYLFASDTLSRNPDPPHQLLRHYQNDSHINRMIGVATRAAGVHKRVTSHTFRHSFATELLRHGTGITVIQKLLGHADIATTQIYLHVELDSDAVVSPLERMLANTLITKPANKRAS